MHYNGRKSTTFSGWVDSRISVLILPVLYYCYELWLEGLSWVAFKFLSWFCMRLSIMQLFATSRKSQRTAGGCLDLDLESMGVSVFSMCCFYFSLQKFLFVYLDPFHFLDIIYVCIKRSLAVDTLSNIYYVFLGLPSSLNVHNPVGWNAVFLNLIA